MFEKLKKEIAEIIEKKGEITIKLLSGKSIKNIKSVDYWGNGLYFGKRKGQKNFSQSVSMYQIQEVIV